MISGFRGLGFKVDNDRPSGHGIFPVLGPRGSYLRDEYSSEASKGQPVQLSC